MKRYYIYALLAFLPFLYSCEGNTHREFTIVNNSSSEIFYEVYGYSPVVSSVASGEQKTFWIEDDLGGQADPGVPTNFISAMLVYTTSDTTTKDYMDVNNWVIASRQVRKIPSQHEHKYFFSLSDSDF